MIDTLYVEHAVAEHPRTQRVLRRFPRARVIPCEHYGELFNRHNQNFRLQKQRPALLLAKKTGRRVLPVPPGYGLDGARGYYFSHMLNCLYDCRYCFLQGMFQSANYVLFVNYEDFVADIRAACADSPAPVWLFSGYDCDSLALEPVTSFARYFVPALSGIDNAWLELRSKSTQVRALLDIEPCARVVCAFSLSPEVVAENLEHRAPSLAARLAAIARLQAGGWPVALRFDPLILVDDFRAQYADFFARVFARLDADAIHSVTLGGFRLPRDHFRRMQALYPHEALFAGNLERRAGMVGYAAETEAEMLAWCETRIAAASSAPIYRQAFE